MPKSIARAIDPAPIVHVVAADVPVTVTPAIAHTLAIPAAGTYQIDIVSHFECGALGASRVLTWTLGTTNYVQLLTGGAVIRNGTAMTAGAPSLANNQPYTSSQGSNARTRLQLDGTLIVSAAAVFTINVSIAADSGLIKAGSFVRARLRSA